jgi:phosphoribosylformimino-5-aminoimidazole carboxamide ribotide isomerase
VITPEVLERHQRYSSHRVSVALMWRTARVCCGWAWAINPRSCAKTWRSRRYAVIYTDVRRDGTGAGLNLAAATSLAQGTGLSVIVSGGVRSLEDVRKAKAAGLSGVIIGRALYDGAISLPEALAC